MNSERLTQHERRKDVPEAVRDEVGIVVAAFPARDRHGEEDRRRGRRPKRRRRCLHATVELIVARGGAHGGREGNIAPAEAVRPGRAAEAAAATSLDGMENRRDGGQRPNAQVLRFPRGQNVGGICR